MSYLTLADFDRIKVRSYRNGDYISALCPFHDDNSPSLLVYADGRFWCKGCQAHGNFEQLKAQLDKVGWKQPPAETFRPAWLGLPETKEGEEALIERAHNLLLDNPSLGWWLAKRGLTDTSIKRFHLGYWQGWIVVPVWSRAEASWQGFMLRATPAMQARTGLRFLDTGHYGGRLYVPDWNLLDRAPYLIVVYGMFDAQSLAQLGFAAATNTDGKDHFKPEYLDWWRKPVYILGDAGEEDAARRKELMHGLGWRGHSLSFDWPEGIKDVNNFFEQRRTGELVQLLGRALSASGARTSRRGDPARAGGGRAASRSLSPTEYRRAYENEWPSRGQAKGAPAAKSAGRNRAAQPVRRKNSRA